MEYPEGWQEVDGALEREFRFKDFAAAIDFVDRLAEIAEERSHHPDIAIHLNHVKVRWWTYAEGRITERDVEMAERTEKLAGGARV